MPFNSMQFKAGSKIYARKHLRDNFPDQLPVALQDPTLKVEHAFLEVEMVIKSFITLIYTTKELHVNFLWFWDAKEGKPRINHFQLATFFDGFPLYGGKSNSTVLCLKTLNLAGLIHRPDFISVLFIIERKEHSPKVIKLVRYCSSKLIHLLRSGIEIEFQGYPPEATIPHHTTALNGIHKITFGEKNLFTADHKATLACNGSNSANQRYEPFFNLHMEQNVHPDFPVSTKNFVPFTARQHLFLQIEAFRETQRQAFIKGARELKKLRTKSNQADIDKKVSSLFQKLMKKDVLDFAARLKTGCIQMSPIPIAEVPITCGLHMDCNEYLRILEHIIKQCAELTLELKR